ncbi:MAG TPA: hypothetical protein VKT32_17070 [Chthonomonadaceae bacterium]|nr:hypothetical protein [Chthonomonadaceae bacterium]
MTIPPHEKHPQLEEVYLAGEWVAAGAYRQIGTNRQVILTEADFLPASLDGRVACYELMEHTWHQIRPQHEKRKERRQQES